MADRGGTGTRPDSIAVGVDDHLSDVVGRVLAARRPVRLEIPTGSPLFLTAAEFRALKDGLGGAAAGVTVATTDPLRRQLASVFGLQTGIPPRPVPHRESAPNAAPPTAVPGGRVIPFPAATPTAASPTTRDPTSPLRQASSPPRQASSPPPPARPAPTNDEVPDLTGKSDDKDTPSFADRTRVVRRPGDQATGSTDVPATVLAHAASRAVGDSPTIPGGRPRPALGRTRKSGRGDEPGGEAAANTAGRVRSRARRWWVVGALVLVAVAAVLLTLALVLPRATILLTLKSQPVTAEFALGVAAPGEAPPPGVDVVVAAEPLRADVSGEWSAATTGTRQQGVEPARGRVALANPNPAAVTLPAGTVLEGADGIGYATAVEVEIPPAGDDGRASNATVEVAAREPGTVANRERGELSGRLAESGVFFSNRDGEIAGGTDRAVPAVAAADLDQLRRQAEAELPARATQTLAGEDGTTTVLPDSLELEPPALSFDLEEGAAGERVTLRATTVATGLGFRSAEVMEQARAAVERGLAGQAPAGYVLDATSVAWTPPVADPAQEGTGRYLVEANGSAVAAFPDERRDALADELAGKGPSDAEKRLRALPETDVVAVAYEPRWLPDRMPFRASRIEIVPAS